MTDSNTRKYGIDEDEGTAHMTVLDSHFNSNSAKQFNEATDPGGEVKFGYGQLTLKDFTKGAIGYMGGAIHVLGLQTLNVSHTNPDDFQNCSDRDNFITTIIKTIVSGFYSAWAVSTLSTR